MTQSDMILLGLSPLILWYVYQRVRRLTVRHRSRLWRHCCAVLFLSAALLALFVMLMAEPAALAALLGGASAGVALGLVALRRTGFEQVGGEHFYTPYAPIGAVVAMIFIARVLYRIVELATLGIGQATAFAGNPPTVGVMSLVGGYHLVCATELLRWRLAQAGAGAEADGTP